MSKEQLFQQRFFLVDLQELFGSTAAALGLREAWPGLREELEWEVGLLLLLLLLLLLQAEKVFGILGLARHHLEQEGEQELSFPVVRCRPVPMLVSFSCSW